MGGVQLKTKYLPKTTGGEIAWLMEECAEVSQACAKTLRLDLEEENGIEDALEGGNPELPPEKRETNRDWILREIKDLEHAIKAVKKALK